MRSSCGRDERRPEPFWASLLSLFFSSRGSVALGGVATNTSARADFVATARVARRESRDFPTRSRLPRRLLLLLLLLLSPPPWPFPANDFRRTGTAIGDTDAIRS